MSNVQSAPYCTCAVYQKLEKECAELRNSAGCTRSHPHEEMTIVCERLAEEARNTNKLANECAELRRVLSEARNFTPHWMWEAIDAAMGEKP
jgi:hypothetical protein